MMREDFDMVTSCRLGVPLKAKTETLIVNHRSKANT